MCFTSSEAGCRKFSDALAPEIQLIAMEDADCHPRPNNPRKSVPTVGKCSSILNNTNYVPLQYPRQLSPRRFMIKLIYTVTRV